MNGDDSCVGEKKNQPRSKKLKTIVYIKICFHLFLLGSHVFLAKVIYFELMQSTKSNKNSAGTIIHQKRVLLYC